MIKRIFRYIVNNKRIMYFSFISILLVFCMILNYTFSLFTTGSNNLSTNITVGDLKYNVIINDVESASVVGIKSDKVNIVGDRIIRSTANDILQYNIKLTSNNNMKTKYEIIYNFCNDASCTSFMNTPPQDVFVYYVQSQDLIMGSIDSNEEITPGIIVVNNSANDYYIQIDLNAGYYHNDLPLVGMITDYFSIANLNGSLSVLAYVDGVPVDSFPTGPDYEPTVICYKDGDGAVSAARGIVRYTSDGWEFDVLGIKGEITTCEVDFESVLQVTYSILQTRYNCANKQDIVENPVLVYTGNCELIDDYSAPNASSTSVVEGDWRLKFLTNGTLTVSGNMYIDVFLVSGGVGGEGAAGTAGGGGLTHTIMPQRIEANNSYEIQIGVGGSPGLGAGGNTVAFGYTLNGATSSYYGSAPGAAYGSGGSQGTTTCEFLEGTTSGCTRGDTFAYAGGGGAGRACWPGSYNDSECTIASGAVGGGGTGGRCGSAVCVLSAGGNGQPNTGGGGGSGGNTVQGASGDGGSGGSGIVIIRNTRNDR